MAALVLAGVTKRFGGRTVVDAASATIEDGQMLTVVGPSGAGKTSLLRAVAGLERVDAGRIVLAGRDITQEPPSGRRVGYVFQDFALFPHLSVRANIGFGVRAGRRARVEAIAQRLQIGSLLDRFPGRLSGGERQRVALARALAVEPAVLLFDEPFASLDAPLRALLRLEIAELRAQTTIPSIFVTHDQDEALALGDHVAVMEAGRIVALDTPRALLAAPPTAFVAGFLGRPPANVLEGMTRGGEFVAGAHSAIRCPAPAAIRSIAVPAEDVVAGLGGDRVCGPGVPITGRVRFVETIGARQYATVIAGDARIVALAHPSARPGAMVELAFDFGRAWMYDARGRYVG